MTKEDAITAMLAGQRVTHEYWHPTYKWITMPNCALIEFWDGSIKSPKEFWQYRNGIEWINGWKIYKNERKWQYLLTSKKRAGQQP